MLINVTAAAVIDSVYNTNITKHNNTFKKLSMSCYTATQKYSIITQQNMMPMYITFIYMYITEIHKIIMTI